MSRKDNLIKSKSIYTLRSRHTVIPNGIIFENDHVTITPNDGIYNEDMPLFSDSNFKFRIGVNSRGRRKHSRGGFVSVDGGDDNVWTLLNLPETEKLKDCKIILKPNYSSLKDFAYYGSAVELLRATVNDVIFRYPGGIYYYKENMAPSITLDAGFGLKKYYLVSNEFNIDYWSPIGCSTDGVDNPLRILGASYMHYVDYKGRPIALNICITGYCPNSVIGRVSFVNISSSDDDNYLPYSLGIDNDIVFGDGANNYIENNIPEPYKYYLSITATTTTNIPIAQKEIVFVATTNKNNTHTASVITDNYGVCGVYVPYNGEGIWHGDANDIYDIRDWVAYYDNGTNLYYNSHTLRIIANREFEDTIIVKDEVPQFNFPFIVWVYFCGTKEPIQSAFVKFYLKVGNEANGTLVKETETNENGIAYFNEDDFDQSLFQNSPTHWYAVVIYDGETHVTETFSMTGASYASTCFDQTQNTIPFLTCSIVGVLNNNGTVGSGNRALINFYTDDVTRYTITGLTDENGTFLVTEEMFHGQFPDIHPIKANGEITYNGETRLSSYVYIFESVLDPHDYILTVYFTEGNGKTKTLLCDVEFTGSQIGPVSGVDVTFTVNTDKSQFVYTAISGSNAYGIAGVDIPSNIWNGNGPISELVLDGNIWTVNCVYEGVSYDGVLGGLSIKNGQYRNIIQIQKECYWPWIIVYANDGSNMLPGAYCTVCASTKSCGNFWYYANGITDAEGKFIVSSNQSDWQHFNGTPFATPNEFLMWKASAVYHGNGPTNPMVTCGILNNISNEYTFVFNETPINPHSTYGCNDMNDDNSFVIFMDGDGNRLLLTDKNGAPENDNPNSIIIEPKKDIIEEFWENIDDFESVLLNRNTKPLYKSVFETPKIEGGKHLYDYRSYVWPTINGYTPDTSSGAFKGYIGKLIEIATYYDEYDSDNLWRMMTHDSIKNLDKSAIIYSDYEKLDLSRMEAMIRIHGRLFDDIVRYANGIKYVNSITYDEKNNLPDYFLSENVDIGGLEVKSINEFQKFDNTERKNQLITSENVFSGSMYSGITTFECNEEFMKRLSLSEDYILSTKGTRRGIEYILGMFGYRYRRDDGTDYADNEICIGDYKITEYIRIANKFPKYMELSQLVLLGNYTHNDTENENILQGYPLNVVIPADSEGEFDYYTIPWVNNGENYLNDIYFQEKGGWGKIHKKNINLDITTSNYIEEASGFTLYSETEPYMMYVSDLEELTSLSNNVIYEGMVCYVTDISGIYSNYKTEIDYDSSIIFAGNEMERTFYDRTGTNPQNIITYESNSTRDYSHYFVLVNTALSNHIGYVRNDLYSCYGWRNVLLREFKDGPITYDGLKVLYLESLSLNTKGNNPHCGFGNYDDGLNYIEKLNRIFGYTIDSGYFDFVKDNPDYAAEFNEICTAGFGISGLTEDNEKCYYFTNTESQFYYDDRTNVNMNELNVSSVDIHGNSCELVQIILDGEDEDVLDESKYNRFVNPESGSTTEECASFSVVNVKNLKITFYTGGNQYFEKYLQDVVFTYLNEMIPSTTIIEFEFVDNCLGLVNHTVSDGDMYDYEGSIVGNIVGHDVSISTSDDDSIYLIENNEGIIN